MKKEILYGFYYCSCVHESAHGLMSLHRKKKNAIAAMTNHKNEAKKEWADSCKWYREKYGEVEDFLKFGKHEDWMVQPVELID